MKPNAIHANSGKNSASNAASQKLSPSASSDSCTADDAAVASSPVISTRRIRRASMSSEDTTMPGPGSGADQGGGGPSKRCGGISIGVWPGIMGSAGIRISGSGRFR
ncbi:hypothetical protein NHF48_011885 [Sphingomonas sp. H160509]|uniref:hypothetical protein n=1 Tax=Sphingomonas sp. H160509 TaxID=2955313 RepID=UPI0020980790|nr:hypothetical protein [Sphingomonas sp. H160509]MDD1451519.1 hypothetical protein [Sphingomonas sp. H160509]